MRSTLYFMFLMLPMSACQTAAELTQNEEFEAQTLKEHIVTLEDSEGNALMETLEELGVHDRISAIGMQQIDVGAITCQTGAEDALHCKLQWGDKVINDKGQKAADLYEILQHAGGIKAQAAELAVRHIDCSRPDTFEAQATCLVAFDKYDEAAVKLDGERGGEFMSALHKIAADNSEQTSATKQEDIEISKITCTASPEEAMDATCFLDWNGQDIKGAHDSAKTLFETLVESGAMQASGETFKVAAMDVRCSLEKSPEARATCSFKTSDQQ